MPECSIRKVEACLAPVVFPVCLCLCPFASSRCTIRPHLPIENSGKALFLISFPQSNLCGIQEHALHRTLVEDCSPAVNLKVPRNKSHIEKSGCRVGSSFYFGPLQFSDIPASGQFRSGSMPAGYLSPSVTPVARVCAGSLSGEEVAQSLY